MLKREIKAARNETLILTLCSLITASFYRPTKGNHKDAREISEELERRGVIESAESFYAEWERQYRA